jgi:uncharacterized membrane protein
MHRSRFWEIDALRGFAIVQMIFFHFVWDLRFFNLIEANIFQGPWQWFARTIATQFIFLAGVSLTLSYAREQQKDHSYQFSKYFLRGLKVFGWGLVITAGTYFFIGRGFVIFGILHLIGFAIILGGLFLPVNKWLTLLVGLVIIGLGLYLEPVVVDYPWLIWLGLKQRGLSMVDYYPAAPWAGLALVGIFAGFSLYPGGRSRLAPPAAWAAQPLVRGLRFLGRHSLLIYLIHQPILIGLILALGFSSYVG